MQNLLKIKEYEDQYQNEVVNLILHIQINEFNIPISKEDQPDLMEIENFYQQGNGNFWVALYHAKVIGTISLLDIGNDEVALRKLFVDEQFRGKSYQTANLLLNTVFDWAKKKSIKTIYLGTTPQFKAAHRFYEKNGFEQIEEDDLPDTFPILNVDKRFYQYHL